MSVLWLKSGYTVKYSLSPQEIPWAFPSWFPSGSGYISPYIPTRVTIQIQYYNLEWFDFCEFFQIYSPNLLFFLLLGWRHSPFLLLLLSKIIIRSPQSILVPWMIIHVQCVKFGLIQVKEEGWTGCSKGWQGCSEGFPNGEAWGKSRGAALPARGKPHPSLLFYLD